MLIFEGTDCVGKSTAAQRCAARLAGQGHLELFKQYGFLPEEWDYHKDYLRDIRTRAVLDRFTTSEAVYGPLFRGGINKKFTSVNQLSVSMALKKAGALTVFICPPLEELRPRLKVRGDKSFDEKQIIDAYKAFGKVILGDQAFPETGMFGGYSCFDGTRLLAFNRYLNEKDLDTIMMWEHLEVHHAKTGK